MTKHLQQWLKVFYSSYNLLFLFYTFVSLYYIFAMIEERVGYFEILFVKI